MTIDRRTFLKACGAASLYPFGLSGRGLAGENGSSRPNILWIYVEDMCPWLSCYGETVIETPALDKLARRGTRFGRFYVPAPVCSPCRSAIITGSMQTTLGVHQHRSSRTKASAIDLPEGVKTIPELFRGAGYHTFNQGKTDYNFTHDRNDLYDFANKQMFRASMQPFKLWKTAVEAGKPFFGQIQLRGGKNTGKVTPLTDPAKVGVMPYYPDCEIVRKEIAHHHDCVVQTDREVFGIMESLKRDGLLENTVVFFFTDHGFRMHRHKQFCYEGGIRTPLIVAGPGIPADAVRNDLVSGIDVGPASLALAGIEVPAHMEGRDLFAGDHEPRTFVVSARDRCDYTIDRIRTVVTERWKYIRNFLTDRPYMQPQYRDPWPLTKELRRMAAEGRLDEVQMRFYGADRPAEELYDLQDDPDEIDNLAGKPERAATLEVMRDILARWMEDTGDRGRQPESEAGLKAALERWGRRCVNPEYEPLKKKYPHLLEDEEPDK